MDKLYAIAAEFDRPEKLLAAGEKARDAGYKDIDAYSPFPIHGMGAALGRGRPILAWVIFAGGIAGMCGGFFLQYWVQVLNLPYNIGGKPLNSWPAFIPITFECTVLAASLTAVIGMLAFNGLPLPHHPIFNHPRFDRATQDRFFLTVEASDEKFDREEVGKFLLSMNPLEVVEVVE